MKIKIENKKVGVFLLCIAVVIFVLVTAMVIIGYGHKDSNPAVGDKPSDFNNNGTVQNDFRIDGIDGLYFITNAEHIDFKENLYLYLNQNNYTDIKVIDVVGYVQPVGESDYNYWLYVSKYNLVLKGTYNMDSGSVKYETENNSAVLDKLGGVKAPVEDGDHGIPDVPLIPQISNYDKVSSHLSKEQFDKELDAFLLLNKEYRRSLTIDEKSIVIQDTFIYFDCFFENNDNEQLGPGVSVMYHKATGGCDFKLKL